MTTHQVGASKDEGGFTLTEVVLAAFLAVLFVGVLLQNLDAHVSFSRAHPAAVDVLERSRAAADLVAADIAMAGAGVDEGAGSGTLACCMPVIEPRAIGARNADPPGTARPDAVSITFAPGSVGGRLQAPLVGATPSLALASGPPCPATALCGLHDEDTVVVFDGIEHHDFYRVSAPAGSPAELRPRQAGGGHSYPSGARVVRVETHTYYHDPIAKQLRHYDGHQSDVPAIDGVVALTFDYWAEDLPPRAPRPPAGTANCLYDAVGTPLPPSGPAPSGGVALVAVAHAALRDGPWCGSGDNRFDADLMRIRRVRMTVTLEAPDELRLSGALFHTPGRGRSVRRVVRDVSLAIDITPRNLNSGR
jgi:hypothetical protein